MISTVEIANMLNVTTQRVTALCKTCGISDGESIFRGRTRFYSRSAVKKLFSHRGLDYSIRRTIALTNNKGGVGKTSISTSLARRLTAMGFEVLLIDVDPQANATTSLLSHDDAQTKVKHVFYDVVLGKASVDEAVVKVQEGLSLLPSSLLNSRVESELNGTKRNPATFVSNLIKNVSANFIIFDMSPSFSNTNVLTTLASETVVIPTLLTRFSVDGVKMTLDSVLDYSREYTGYDPEVKLLINQMDSRLSTSLAFAGDLNAIELSYNEKGLNTSLFRTVIRVDNAINRVQTGATDLSSTSNFYKDICELTDELVGAEVLKSEANLSVRVQPELSIQV